MVRSWIETFQAQTHLDLLPLWLTPSAAGGLQPALADPWGAEHRPDWHARGLLIWPRGGRWRRLHLALVCPPAWRADQRGDRQARLVLRWWAEAMELRVDGQPVHAGDLFDSACRWLLPVRWWQGQALQLELDLRSPLHDDGALIDSRLELEPCDPRDPAGLLAAPALALAELRLGEAQRQGLAADLARLDPADPAVLAPLRPWLQRAAEQRPAGGFHVLGHAHLDLAWLWPVADTWQAAIRTFDSALALLERHPQLHFAHSSPALYAWIEQHRPALFARIRAAMRAGRWEPINGPWVESDCVLISTASLLRQFQLGQTYSRAAFPEWRHELCWLPDSFGFAAGLPAVAAATGVRWFCTHKLAWNATNPFPHRLFRWRSRCGAEVLALMTAPIGTDGDPLAMERYRLQWQAGTGLNEALWLPGVGDHGGGPTAEMLQQLELWQQQPLACPQQHGPLRGYLERLEPLASQLPVWRDELYLELHRGCATSRPDQKRHNRSLERLLREADLARGLLALSQPSAPAAQGVADWRPLLFQQFHDILPGTSISAVFEQAEPQWRAARRSAAGLRDRALRQLLGPLPPAGWWLMPLQPHGAGPITLRLPAGRWRLADPAAAEGLELPSQPAPGGGAWVQLPLPGGIAAVALRRQPGETARACTPPAPPEPAVASPIAHPVLLQELQGGQSPGDPSSRDGDRRWRLSNGLVQAELAGSGVQQLWGGDGRPQLAAPLQWCRWRDGGEFWDAWDLAADYRDHPLPLVWQEAPEVLEQGPLCARLVWRGRCGRSPLRLDVQLRAASPWLELTLRVDWRQRHELLRLEIPLAQPALRLAADTSGGVLERPALARTPREQARWELPAISWIASQSAAAGDGAGVAAGGGGGLAVLLDGPQGVSGTPERLGVSLLRAPTWPDPGADNGLQRLRLALMPLAEGWRQQGVARQARCFREPLWRRPACAGEGLQCSLPPLAFGDPALELIGVEPADQTGELVLTVQNLSPLRQPLRLSPGWRQLDGPSVLRPWRLQRLRLGLADGDQSS